MTKRAMPCEIHAKTQACSAVCEDEAINLECSSELVVDSQRLEHATTERSRKAKCLNPCPALGTFDGDNCLVGEAPKGTEAFIYDGNFYYTPIPCPECPSGSHCPSGSFDSVNCFVGDPPDNTQAFIYDGGFYYTPLPGNSCPIGRFDGANCFVSKAPQGAKPFIYENRFYYIPLPCPNCPSVWFDGANCFAGKPPAGATPFLLDGGFYYTPLPGSDCPIGSFDQANCFVGKAPPGAEPFIYENRFYFKPIPGSKQCCSEGASFDTANCFVKDIPQGVSGFISGNEYYVKASCEAMSDPFIPNVFTPNGDGYNDVWGLTNLEEVCLVSVDIYTRAGSKIFTETREVGGLATVFLWDGRTASGTAVSEGTYFYIVEIVNCMGRKRYTGIIQLLRGR